MTTVPIEKRDLEVHDPFADGDLTAALTPTAPQHELWLASKVGGDDANRAFNECLALTLRGALNVELLEAALQALIDRHEALRCSFTTDGQRFTVVSSHRGHLTHRDLAALPEPERGRALAELVREEMETPFVLEHAPLLRATLVRLAPNLHQLIFSAHHVVCDGWSSGVLMHELAAFYRAGAKTWPNSLSAESAGLKPPTSFATYASALRSRAQTSDGARDEAFWMNQLAGDIKQIDLPTDHARPPRRTYASKRIDLELDPKLLGPLRALGAKSGCTFLVTLMGVFQTWLYRLTAQRDLVLGMPAAGQAVVDADSLVGHCVHVLPIRMTVDPAMSLPAHLAAFKPVLLNALDARQVTFSSLLRKLNLPYDSSRIPLIPVCINVDNGLGKLDFGDLVVTSETVPRAFETFELLINAVDHRDRLVVEWSYSTALFDEKTIRRWMAEIETLVAAVLARPDVPIKQLNLLEPGEKELLRLLNETFRPLPGLLVHEQVAATARERPAHTAVRFAGRSLLYRDLDRQANQLARHLRRRGVRERECVGVFINRSEKLPVVLLAVLKSGASYVPMDPSYPADRLAMMAEDSGMRVVLTETDLLPALPRVETALCLDALQSEVAAESDEPLGLAVAGEDRAYVLFTSGSTGRPKGVEVPHRAFENLLRSVQREPGFSQDDRLLALTTVSFDIAGLDMFLPLITGGTMVIADRRTATDPEAIAEMLVKEEITVMQVTPATWRMLIDVGWKGRDCLRVFCGGEAMTPGLAAELLDRSREVWNMYGPTETTIYSAIKRVERGTRVVTIGKPIDNTNVYILDENLSQVPVSATGEIWIGGTGVALGYIGRPELTGERFIDSPFVRGERIYRTGDLGRILPEGEIECLGRSDSQVKIRGFRVELAEIESAVERCPGIRKAVVKLVQRGQAGQLVAYWVADPNSKVEATTVDEYLRKALPPYMLPQHYVMLDTWPMTPAGKIDRRALPVPKSDRAGPAEPLRDDVDVSVAEIWQELLGVEEVGLGDDFFSLGGQSMLAVRFVATVKARLGVPFNLATLFSSPTLREVGDAIRRGGGHIDRGAVVLRREPEAATRVFFICGVHIYRALAQNLGEGFESYGVIVMADERLEIALRTNVAPELDLPSLLKEYLAAIRAVQPHGPYHLAGVSFGGLLAYELARHLRAAGEEVGLLALLDPILPSAVQKDRMRQFHQFMKAEGVWNLSARVAKKLLRKESGASEASESKSDPTTQLAELRNEAYEKLTTKWDRTAQPYGGDAVLFRATDVSVFRGFSIAHDLGWGRLVRGKLAIHELPGTHLGILQAPIVEQLGEIMRSHLKAIQETAGGAQRETR
jgi:amino acid adenylation domain-containing protein